MNDTRSSDPAGLTAVCVAITLCIMGYWFSQGLQAKDAQIRQLELEKAALQGQLVGRR